MRECFKHSAAVVLLFLAGVLFGAHALYCQLRVNAVEARLVGLEQGVQQFAKEVNAALNPQKPVALAPAQALPVDPAKK